MKFLVLSKNAQLLDLSIRSTVALQPWPGITLVNLPTLQISADTFVDRNSCSRSPLRPGLIITGLWIQQLRIRSSLVLTSSYGNAETFLNRRTRQPTNTTPNVLWSKVLRDLRERNWRGERVKERMFEVEPGDDQDDAEDVARKMGICKATRKIKKKGSQKNKWKKKRRR